jgi:glycosyltransferase involved in cell wall biosynthesis
MRQESSINTSIIIPHKNDFSSLKKLLFHLDDSLYSDCEILVVDSSAHHIYVNLEEIAKQSTVSVKIIRGDNYYPGHARNIGAKSALGQILFFLDSKTIPSKNCLADGLLLLGQDYQSLVIGKFESIEYTLFGKIVKAATFGNIPHYSIPGTLIYKKLFLQSGGFNPIIRAGEDIDWLNRLKQIGCTIKKPTDVTLIYSGLPDSLLGIAKKWYLYSMENAKVNILTIQKSVYFSFLLFFILYLAYRWNYIFTDGAWDSSPYFIPHLNKVLWSTLGICYISLRALILPLQRQEKLTFLLPVNFIFVAIVSLIMDFAKIPGRIYGFWKMLTYTNKL